MKIPRTVVAKKQFQALVKNCKAVPTLAKLNRVEDLLETERSFATTARGIRERLSELESRVAKDKRFQEKVSAELIEPENPTPTKLKKHKRKFGFNP